MACERCAQRVQLLGRLRGRLFAKVNKARLLRAARLGKLGFRGFIIIGLECILSRCFPVVNIHNRKMILQYHLLSVCDGSTVLLQEEQLSLALILRSSDLC